jgi:sec-independent protein translocase protein TatA
MIADCAGCCRCYNDWVYTEEFLDWFNLQRLNQSYTYGDKIMPSLGGWEWVIILVIILLIFGIGRIGKLGEELGKGVRAFREGVKDGTKEDGAEEEEKVE